MKEKSEDDKLNGFTFKTKSVTYTAYTPSWQYSLANYRMNFNMYFVSLISFMCSCFPSSWLAPAKVRTCVKLVRTSLERRHSSRPRPSRSPRTLSPEVRWQTKDPQSTGGGTEGCTLHRITQDSSASGSIGKTWSLEGPPGFILFPFALNDPFPEKGLK